MRRSWTGSVFLGLILVASPPSPVRAQPAGERYALLVGVRQYDAPELRELSYAEADVTELGRVLLEEGYRPENTVVMTLARGGENLRRLPLGSRIRRELGLLLQDRKPTDSVVVALAGHGVKPRGGNASYFCPADADLGDPKTLIAFDEVYRALEACRAGFKLLLVDACRNDPLTRNSRARATVHLESLTRPDLPAPPGGVVALFSCSAGEVAFEDDGLRHGVFFHYVIEGLRGRAARERDGRVTLPLLEDYVKDNVERFVRDKHGVRQMPERLGREAGTVTLASRRGRPTAPRAITNTLGMKLTLIPAGEFLMGSGDDDAEADADEKPRHRVRINRPFLLGTMEVTQGEYRAAIGRNPSLFKGPDTLPVENVTWSDAIAFCDALSTREGLPPYYRPARVRPGDAEGYRLPTEAEWEYACRAGTATKYSFGDDEASLGEYAWFVGNSGRTSHPVGLKRPNAFGLYDMHGNVWEWCGDAFDPRYYAQSPVDDPAGAPQSISRVNRGGAWGRFPRLCRSAHRLSSVPNYRNSFLGFRVARTQPGR